MKQADDLVNTILIYLITFLISNYKLIIMNQEHRPLSLHLK